MVGAAARWRPASIATRVQQLPQTLVPCLNDKFHRTAGLPQASQAAIWKLFQLGLPQLARHGSCNMHARHAPAAAPVLGAKSRAACPRTCGPTHPLTTLTKQTTNHRERGVPCRGGSRRRCLGRRQRARLRGAGRARECLRQLCRNLKRKPAGSRSLPVVWAASSRARSTAAACGRLLWLLFMITGV